MHRVYHSIQPRKDSIELTGDAFHYISRVIRLDPGDRLVLFDESGLEQIAEVETFTRHSVRVRILEQRPNRCEADRAVWLVQGYPKGTKLFDIVRAAAALGVAGVVPFIAKRSIAGKGDRSRGWLERCQKISLEASRQCGRCQCAEILEPADSLEEALDRLAARGPRPGICLWEEAERPLSETLAALSPSKEPLVAVVVGPEGGLTKEEADTANSKGLPFCTLGPRILRTELAPVAALSILQYHLGQME
jgi:16S rRNA (uracil1498-N3)-methyltransferase